jgi:hypothetical protein
MMIRFPWRQATFALLLLVPAPGLVHAAEPAGNPEQMRQALARIVGPLSAVKALVAHCDAVSAEGRDKREAAFQAWRAAYRIEAFETALAQLMAHTKDSEGVQRKLQEVSANAAKKLLQEKPDLCAELSFEASDKDRAFGEQIARILPVLETAVARLKTVTATGYPRLHTIVQLSTLADTAMNAVAPVNTTDSKASDRREKAGDAALEALGIVAIAGHVIGDDELREWRGEQQSSYRAECSSFNDKESKEKLKALKGSEAKIAAWIDRIRAYGSGGGWIVLKKCIVLQQNELLVNAELPEAGGLELRPPTAQEANAGPGKGIPVKDIEKVAYKSDLRTSLDLRGGVHMERDEDTYLLLKDGTAYHYPWGFPFTDLDVVLVKRRQPGLWFHWRLDGKDLVLTPMDGAKNTKPRTVEDVSTLDPFPPGATLEQTFEFLHVSGIGARRDRKLAFHRDGRIDMHSSSLFAGHIGPSASIGVSGPGVAFSGGNDSFLTAIGPKRERHLRYKIDGYVLELTADDGAKERHFIARMGDDDAKAPGLLYFNGAMHWKEEKEEKK